MKVLPALALLLLAPVTFAADLDHDYLEVGYFQGEIEDAFFPIDFDGLELRGSKAFGNWLLLGGYEDISFDPIDFFGFVESSFSRTTLQFGGGYRFALHDRLDLTPGLGVVRAEIRSDFVDLDTGVSETETDSDSGYFVSLGLRGRLMDRLEVEFNHRFMNVMADRANDWRFDVRYAFTPAFSASLGYHDFEGDNAIDAALRWHF